MNPIKRTPGGTGILLAFILLMLTLAGCEKGTLGVNGGSVSGSVLDSQTLYGISGVNVTAEAGEGDSLASKFTSTDSKGTFYFADLRPGEWRLSFDKIGYSPINQSSSGTIRVVAVNNEHRNVSEVRMLPTYSNINITIRGSLKDAKTGSPITLGTAQFIFGNKVYNNEYPTHLESGLQAPSSEKELQVTIKVTGYDTYTTVLQNAVTDRDLGVILLNPQTYKIVGAWKDVPGWVQRAANNTAKVFAYSSTRILIGTASANMAEQSFEIQGIPMGQAVSIEAEIRGYRMNSPVLVTPTGGFQGTQYQTLSLKTNFSPILRDVRMVLYGNNISRGDRVGGYCVETGTQWPQRVVTTPVGTPLRVVDLDITQIPTGYSLTFSGYDVDTGTLGNNTLFIDDDGVEAQIVRIQL